jgi:hypothetical protein
LLVGALADDDIEQLLVLIHPETWEEGFAKGQLTNQ